MPPAADDIQHPRVLMIYNTAGVDDIHAVRDDIHAVRDDIWTPNAVLYIINTRGCCISSAAGGISSDPRGLYHGSVIKKLPALPPYSGGARSRLRARSHFGSCVINAIHSQNAASLPSPTATQALSGAGTSCSHAPSKTKDTPMPKK